jgi:hypothetical protein
LRGEDEENGIEKKFFSSALTKVFIAFDFGGVFCLFMLLCAITTTAGALPIAIAVDIEKVFLLNQKESLAESRAIKFLWRKFPID